MSTSKHTNFLANMSLSGKSGLTVFVPLALTLTLLLIFAWLLKEAELAIYVEQRSKAVVTGTSELQRLLFESSNSIAGFAFTSNELFQRRYEHLVARIGVQYSELAQLTSKNEEESACLKRMDEPLKNAVAILNTSMAEASRGTGLRVFRTMNLAATSSDIMRAFEPCLRELTAIRAIEQRVPRGNGQTRELLFNILKMVIWIGVGLSILTALVMQFMFGRSVIERLGVISGNTKLLSGGQSLQPRLSGSDEIAELDEAFHQMSEALDEARARLKETEALKQEFISMISHDLRTPLASIQMFLSMMYSGIFGELPDALVSRAQTTEASAVRLINLLNDLLDLEKMESGQLVMASRVVSVQKLLSRAQSEMEALAEARKMRILITGEANAHINVDESRLVQVLVNLLSNALKFSPNGTTVTLDATVHEGEIEISVTDQGPGISPEHCSQLFARYKQVGTETSSGIKGTGLGLAISKSIVEQLGGSIGVRSVLGSGATFWFRLPVVEQTEKPS